MRVTHPRLAADLGRSGRLGVAVITLVRMPLILRALLDAGLGRRLRRHLMASLHDAVGRRCLRRDWLTPLRGLLRSWLRRSSHAPLHGLVRRRLRRGGRTPLYGLARRRGLRRGRLAALHEPLFCDFSLVPPTRGARRIARRCFVLSNQPCEFDQRVRSSLPCRRRSSRALCSRDRRCRIRAYATISVVRHAYPYTVSGVPLSCESASTAVRRWAFASGLDVLHRPITLRMAHRPRAAQAPRREP